MTGNKNRILVIVTYDTSILLFWSFILIYRLAMKMNDTKGRLLCHLDITFFPLGKSMSYTIKLG